MKTQNNPMRGKEILIQSHQVKTQKDAVKCHLRDYGSITSMSAFNEYGITRLASIIHTLRSEGYKIHSTPQSRRNRYGNSVEFAKYEYLNPNYGNH